MVTRNRILALGRSDEVSVPRGARTVDAAGKYLVPGLSDMHVHFAVFWELKRARVAERLADRDRPCTPTSSSQRSRATPTPNSSRTRPRHAALERLRRGRE
ncbi:MAG: hypothetical protein ABR499_15555 [Gemmatimonadaceae bacterium]